MFSHSVEDYRKYSCPNSSRSQRQVVESVLGALFVCLQATIYYNKSPSSSSLWLWIWKQTHPTRLDSEDTMCVCFMCMFHNGLIWVNFTMGDSCRSTKAAHCTNSECKGVGCCQFGSLQIRSDFPAQPEVAVNLLASQPNELKLLTHARKSEAGPLPAQPRNNYYHMLP